MGSNLCILLHSCDFSLRDLKPLSSKYRWPMSATNMCDSPLHAVCSALLKQISGLAAVLPYSS